MNKCNRCGSKVDYSKSSEFKCIKCENIKINRKLLEPIENQVKENFQKAKNSKYGFLLKHLYLFGGYLKGKEKCCDIDFLLTYDGEKMVDYIDSRLERYSENLLESCFNDENNVVYVKKLLEFLDNTEFWDFRTCDEYPDCLECFEDEKCDYMEKFEMDSDEFYKGLHKYGVHTYCIEECSSPIRTNFGIPMCCLFQNDCNFYRAGDENHFRNNQIKIKILNDLIDIIKKDADLEFERSGLRVKVLHLNPAASINKFLRMNKHFDLNEKEDFKKIA
ncbi:MAG: hypothetical protein EU550_02380 [Promethearchaeota archaeon]|nr:MAG: hypothetical protein EU550_02380 [Candidatus Lokiarchaeota archaeon]